MILYVNEKGKQLHNIIDVCTQYYYTACGEKVPRDKKTTTIMAAATIENSCASCNEIYKRSYLMNPSENVRIIYSSHSLLNEVREYHQLNIIGPKAKFEHILNSRSTPHFRRLKKYVRNSK
jgi:hypothetical protein